MNLDYIIKKCDGFGFSNSIKNVKLDKFKENNIYYIYTEEGINNNEKHNFITLNQQIKPLLDDEIFKTDFDYEKPTLFIIEVGNEVEENEKVDIRLSIDEINEIIDKHDIKNNVSDDVKNKYKQTLKIIVEKPLTYLNYEYNASFLDYLQDIYCYINDGYIQKTILKILQFNGVRIEDLIKEHDITTKTEKINVVKTNKLFNDMNIKDPFYNKDTEEETETDDILRKLSTQKISQFNGFTDSFSKIDSTKTNINSKNTILMRNYEVINMLVRNKIVTEPTVMIKYNFEKMMEIFNKFKHFSVVFVWPNYESNFNYAQAPNHLLEISGNDGNVILNVIFRYICLNYFGMYTTYNNENKFMKYVI